jgi:predicted esterase
MEHAIRFSFTGRYFTLGNKEKAKQIWFVLHGYGQLASYFIKKFKVLEDYNILVIAPEGLSRFYIDDIEKRLQTGSTRVGASWMTRENRLSDIQNYISFLTSIYETETPDKNIPVTVLGFSQGAATAARWVIDGKITFSRLILWAGILPPDLDFTKGKNILQSKETFLVYGSRDPFLHDDRFTEMNLLSEKLGITPHLIEFDGEHTIDEKALLKLV